MAEELKTRSFRIEDATAEQFKAIAQEIGGNQQQALSKLIECYELQKGKAMLADKKGDIETFENYITSITNMFMSSLQDNQNMRENVRAEYDSLLQSKDATIIELQEKVQSIKEVESASKEEVKRLQTELDACKHNLSVTEKALQDDRKNYESIIADKDNLNKALTDAHTSLKKELQGVDIAKEELKALQDKYESLQGEHNTTLEQYRELQSKFEQSKLEHERVLLEQERKYHDELSSLQARYVTMLEEKIKTPARRNTKKKAQEQEQETPTTK